MKVIDMHCDTIAELYQKRMRGEEASILENSLSVSLNKMEKGDYGLQNFAMFVHLEKAEGHPFTACMQLADTFFTQMRAFSDKISMVRNWKEIEENWKAGKMSALLTAEEGGICQGELSLLRILYELGVRMMTLTWNYPNELGYPNLMKREPDGTKILKADDVHGLTEKGIAFLEEMERLGMIVDISHLNDKGLWDVFHYTKKPFVASHSNCRRLSPHPRNLTDEMIKALAERGGVAGLNFCAAFLAEEEIDGVQTSSIEDMLRHIRHMKQIGGIEVIGLGTDFDGIENPVEIRDASCMQALAEAMEKDGFTIGEIEKVFHGNVLRVYRELLA